MLIRVKKAGIGCILSLCLIISFTACGKDVIVDDKVYTPPSSLSNEKELLAKGMPIKDDEPFTPYQNLIAKDDINKIVASISPDKKKIIFLDKLAPSDKFKIQGPTFVNKAEIVVYDVEKKTKTVIGSNMIKIARWNSTSDKLAFIDSDDRLYLYDSIKKQTVLGTKLTDKSSMEWSSDGTKIYLASSDRKEIFYTDTKRRTLYNEWEYSTFIVGKLDENNKIIFRYEVPYEHANSNQSVKRRTANKKLYVVNNDNHILNSLKNGNIKGVYKRSILLTGPDGFKLYYYKDFKQEEPILVSEDYIYDAGFVEGGNFIFTNANEDVNGNYFDLSFVGKNGSVNKKIKSQSSNIYIMPDGKKAIGNLNYPQITFSNNGMNVISESGPIEPKFTAEDESVFKTVRGAMALYYKMIPAPDKKPDFSAYFADSQNPVQSALYEVTENQAIINNNWVRDGGVPIESLKKGKYAIDITVNNSKPGSASAVSAVEYYKVQNEERAQVALSVQEITLELIKKEGKWYVTGICTYPRTNIARDAKARAEKFLQEKNYSGSFERLLKNKNVKVGQVQFRQITSPDIPLYVENPILSANVESSNYCLINLHVNDNNIEHVYKLAMKKEGKGWNVSDIIEDTTYGLFGDIFEKMKLNNGGG